MSTDTQLRAQTLSSEHRHSTQRTDTQLRGQTLNSEDQQFKWPTGLGGNVNERKKTPLGDISLRHIHPFVNLPSVHLNHNIIRPCPVQLKLINQARRMPLLMFVLRPVERTRDVSIASAGTVTIRILMVRVTYSVQAQLLVTVTLPQCHTRKCVKYSSSA